MRRGVLLVAIWMALSGATPLPLAPPLPDLSPLVPFVAAPLDKPPVLADAPLPRAPGDVPPLPPVPITLPAAEKPVAFLMAPRTLPCIPGMAWIGVASESLECGRARFQRGEYEEAAKALENAARPNVDRDVLREARYWLGETYYRLGRVEQADWLFRQVVQDGGRQDVGLWAVHSSGWTALRVGEPARARDAFASVLSGGAPAVLEVWARHGLGLANYALGRHEEAEQAWNLVLQRAAQSALARDALFWHGEALGRANKPAAAEAELRRFVDGGAHPLATTARLRLAWWTLAAGHVPESVAAFRAYLALPPATTGAEREWGELGLALALLSGGDWSGARDAAGVLAARKSPLAVPLMLRLARAALDSPMTVQIESLVQDLLAANLTPAARGWVLIVKGEVDRAQGNRDEARTQFDLARKVAAGTPVVAQATFRLARTNYELREFQQAQMDLAALGAATPPELRAAVLSLQGEAAYQAGDYAAAGAAFRRLLVEASDATMTPMVRLAIAWCSLRQGQAEAARREFLEFARLVPDHASAADALELAAELALNAGDYESARQLLERIGQTYPNHPRADFARINRAILLIRTGNAAGAKMELTDWLARKPFPALSGRAHAALAAALLETGDTAGAQQELIAAKQEGLGAFANLGTGVVALHDQHWDAAVRAFEQARDAGTPDIAAVAEYGLAAARFGKGELKEFRKPAETALAALPRGPRGAERAGALLYVLTGIAVEDKDWRAALGYARRLMTSYPDHEAADDALERIAHGAAAVPVWSVVTEADTLLQQRYPQSPFVAAARIRLAEGFVETNKLDPARQQLEKFLADSPNDARARLLLARVREAIGDRAGALEAYSRAARDSRGPELSTPALLGHARLLVQDQRWDQARNVAERLLKNADGPVTGEAAQIIAEAYAGEGDALAAAEYYLTAAYVTPTAAPGRAWLGAARAFVKLRQNEPAANAYRKCLAQPDVAADIADACRKGLAALPH